MGAILCSSFSKSVSAAELVRGFAECREAAAKQPVGITHHGRTTHVLLGIDCFKDMRAAADFEQDKTVPDSLLVYTLADWLDAGLILCDAAMSILFVNRVAQAITRSPSHALIGKPLLEALPQTIGSLWETHTRRTMTGGEFSTADMLSPFQPDGWLHFQSFPLGPWNALLFNDITDDVNRHRMADVKAAILDAMGLHGSIYYARLSVRGSIDHVNQPCCELFGLAADHLQGVPLAELLIREDRTEFCAMLEAVLRGEGDRTLKIRLFSSDGHTKAIAVSLVQLQGAFGVEGAVMLATEIAPDGSSQAA